MSTPFLEPLGKVRTKIVATLGPATRGRAMIRQLVEAGVDVFRLNFSHGTHADHTEALADVRAVGDETGRRLAVLQDLGGPKIRLGAIPGDAVDCRLGDEFTLVVERTADNPHQLTCTYRDLARDLKPADLVLFADGTVAMVVIASDENGARLKVTLPGLLRSHQGVNLPGAALNLSALTEKDLRDLEWTARSEVEYVGLSFVRRASDVVALREELQRRGSRARIVSKIEKPQALEDLDAIIAESDAVMVARGDLGVEIDVARVPAIQKQVIAACNRARVPVITATQMLNSMEQSSRPTRAEASDVFNAVLDGTDAVMLSGESAVGKYPVEAVSAMSRIAAEAESLLFGGANAGGMAPSLLAPSPAPGRGGWVSPITEGVVEAASVLSRRVGAALLVVATHSGRTALALSKQRHPTRTLALADDPETARAMALYWGVTPIHDPEISNAEHALDHALAWARARALIAPGDRVVLVSGTMPGNPTHNALLVREVE
ncbi:pyruvate kinase [Singulisphaera acidiphila]|uniref:Pyruvate kinase n=3 Tax=Singulisphaera acidiphila TaxID=466153 RepID=L0DR15_SINAD|nr:pyruvate kinase [Singulisphaera acidiphila]AGA31402.1 pyruvate kinase [Singulisphaera acidiphila DSM 18658]